jgi:Bacterial Ig-like domain
VLAQRRSSRLLVAAATASATLVALLAVAATPAQAAVKAPTGLSPHGAVSSSTPTFTWSRVAGATSYQVVVTSDTTSQDLISTSTANNRFVPLTNLPDGSYSWRVRATGPTGTSGWANAAMSVSPTAPPSLTSPVGGQHLTQPDSPALLMWSAVPGAFGYEVQVDNSGTWVNPTTYSVKGNSYFVDTPQAPGTWYWRVRAIRGQGLFTSWSSQATYVVDQLLDPLAGADMNTGTAKQDVAIDWLPVDGATSYQLQVGRDKDFNNVVDDVVVDGTTYAPAVTYDNDQYYWRVRAIDAGQNRMPWTTAAPFTFQRNWPDQPTLEYPANQFAPAVGDPMYFQWTAVRHASRYQIDVGKDPNFSPNTFSSCLTTGTTFPVNGSCPPMGQGATTYWRVKGLDDPRGVEGIFSDIHHFVYSSAKITQLSPANGAVVDVPTMTWQPVANVQSYLLTVSDTNNNIVANVATSSTSWTPEGKLPTSGNPYSWTVRAVPYQGIASPLFPGKTFSVSGTVPTSAPALLPITGLAGDPATTDFPDLTWGAMTGATYYRVRIGVQDSNFWDQNASYINTAAYTYPAATDVDTHYLSPGTYFWFVDAYDQNNHLIGETPSDEYGEFKVKDLALSSGQEIALDGLAAVSPSAGCDNALSNVAEESQICTGVPATPVLKWDAEPGAAGYLVYLANDQELTNRVVTPFAATNNTMWRPPSDLPDNTAQDSYYWFIRPCKSMAPLMCNPDPISTHAAATNAFRKSSAPVALQTPTDGASLASDPSFKWTDYYDTNPALSYAGGTDRSYQTGRTYRIQVATSPTFNANFIVVDREVDQPFYTAADRTLPQGLLYWRVQVVDPTVNRLTWSQVRSLSNDQPAVDLVHSAVTAPAIDANVGGTPAFRWPAMDGASSYQIQVFRNNDATHSDANLVVNNTTRVPAFVPQNFLPTSSSAYRWRVRWVDADGQPRPWSSDATFSVKAKTVTLNSPTTNTYQRFNALYFSWDAAPFASSYLLDVRDANSGGGAYSVTTTATAHAPGAFSNGAYDWRVQALDPNGNPIATSAWRHFTVDSVAPTVTAFSPGSLGTPKSKVKVTFSEKVVGVSPSSFTLHVKGRSSKLPAKVTVASSKRAVTLTPKANLKKGKVYTVKIASNVHDAAGNHMTLFTWSFLV